MNNEDHNFIFVKKGNIPILLTIPHGGTIDIPNCPVRNNGIITADRNTLHLAELIYEHMESNTTLYPYIVGLRCSRKYIDVNRSEKDAYETETLKSIYHAYHEQIKVYIAEINNLFQNQSPLLIDIHGQITDNNTIFRGTKDKETLQPLLTQHGQEVLFGPNSILGQMVKQGYNTYPLLTQTQQKEHPSYNGGFTLSTYKNCINALQLEFG